MTKVMSNPAQNANFTSPHWRIKKFNTEKVKELSQKSGLRSEFVKAIMALGLEEWSEVENFISPSFSNWMKQDPFPSLLTGAKLLHDALLNGEKVCIHGDFDTDGILATVILKECLCALGFQPEVYLPSREDGHGLSEHSIRKIKEKNIDLIISVDCGINAIGPAKLANELGMKLLVTDHHLPDEELPEACAIVNPQLDEMAQYKVLSGAGVSFKLGLELAKRLPPSKSNNEQFRKFIPHAIVLAAIATIGDVVPLRGENRPLVKKALELIGNIEWPALKLLMETSGLKNGASAEDLAYQLIPRLNAAQRMEEGELVWKLFNTKNESQAADICKRLSKLNEERKNHQAEHFQSILTRLQKELADAVPECIFIVGGDWKEGISGLIANKVAEKYARPVAVLLAEEDRFKASLRAPDGYQLKKGLDYCSDYLERHGGHNGAAGLCLKMNQLENFKTAFDQEMAKQRCQMMEEGRQNEPVVMIVDTFDWKDVSMDLMREAQIMEPHGQENKKPVYASCGLHFDGSPKYIGKNGEHVIASFHIKGSRSIETIGFGLRPQFESIDRFGKVDIAWKLGKSRYGQRLQLHLVSIRQHRDKSKG